MVPPLRTLTQTLVSAANVALILAVLVVGAVLARRNLRANRADRTGAGTLGLSLIALQFTGWLLSAHFVSTPDAQLRELLSAISYIGFFGAFVWALYLAIEPYARRQWPDALLGWTRLLSGHVRDPRVGRDILIGLSLASATIFMEAAQAFLAVRFGHAAPRPPFGGNAMVLASTSLIVTRWISMLYNTMQSTLIFTAILIVMRLLFKRGWLALAASLIVLTVLTDGGAALTGTLLDFVAYVTVIGVSTFVLFRFGMLALAVGSFADTVATNMPMTLQLSLWWATPAALSLALLLGLAAFGFYAARTGQPLFGNLEATT